MEPYRLKRFKWPTGRLYSCARPGRSKGANGSVDTSLVNKWVQNLPSGDIVLISLLGRKPDGTSEFSFYPFCGNDEIPTKTRPHFRDWLATNHPNRKIRLEDFATTDYQKFEGTLLAQAMDAVKAHLATAQTVVIVDSGGVQRSGQLCRALGAKETL